MQGILAFVHRLQKWISYMQTMQSSGELLVECSLRVPGASALLMVFIAGFDESKLIYCCRRL